MSEEDIKELLSYVDQDIKLLFEGIEQHELELKELLDYIKIGKPFFTFDTFFFTSLCNRYCYKDFDSEGLIPLEKREKLIEKIFFSAHNVDFNNERFFLPSSGEDFSMTIAWPALFLVQFYKEIFCRIILTSGQIDKIFKDLIKEWNSAITNLEMSVSIMCYLPFYAKIGEYELGENIRLLSKIPYIKLDDISLKSGLIYRNYMLSYFNVDDPANLDLVDPMKCYLVFNTQIPFIRAQTGYDFYGMVRSEFRDEVQRIEKKITEVINTLYLFDLSFKFGGNTIKYPWWFEGDLKEINKKYISEIEYRHEIIDEQMKNLSEFYSKVEESEVFLDNNFEIIAHRYYQIHNRDDLQDIIIDACIILEFLFTGSERQELSYRLSLNAALFISGDWNQFKTEFDKLRSIYKLRNDIVHGGDWRNGLKKLIREGTFSDEDRLRKEIRWIISKILKKLVLIKLQDPFFLKKFRKEINYFLDNSDLIKKS